MRIFDYCINVIFFADLLLNTNTAYFSDAADAFVLDRSKILENYWKSGMFMIDLVSCIPFDDIVAAGVSGGPPQLASHEKVQQTSTVNLVKVIRLLRLMKLLKASSVNVSKVLNRLEEIFNVSPIMVNLLSTIVEVIFISHLVSCMWWGLCWQLSIDSNEVSWFDTESQVYNKLGDANFQDQYVAALYWTITTLTSTGFGDIVPTTDHERVVNIFVMVIGATVFGFVVANISNIVHEFNAKKASSNCRIGMIKEYLRDNACPSSVSHDVLNYFRRALRKHSTVDDTIILSRMPHFLRVSIQVMDAQMLFDSIPVFKHIKSDSLKLFLLHLLNFSSVEKGEKIIKEGDAATEIILMTHGQATICRILGPVQVSSIKAKRSGVMGSTFDVASTPLKKLVAFVHDTPNKLFGMAPLAGEDDDDDGEDSEDDEVIARRERKALDDQRRKTRSIELWTKVRTELTRIVSMGRDENNFTGIVHLVQPKISKISIIMHGNMNAALRQKSVHGLNSGADLTGSNKEGVVVDSSEPVEVACDVEELGELRVGDVFGFHAMRLSLTHACSVVASETCHYYTLSRSDLLTVTKSHPDIAFQLQSALGVTIFEADRLQGKRQARKRKIEFLNGIKARFKAVNQGATKKPHLATLIKRLSQAPPEEKQAMLARFRLLAEKERREKSSFAPFYRILEKIRPLIPPEQQDDIMRPPSPIPLAYDDLMSPAGHRAGRGHVGSRSPATSTTPTPAALTINPNAVSNLDDVDGLNDSLLSAGGTTPHPTPSITTPTQAAARSARFTEALNRRLSSRGGMGIVGGLGVSADEGPGKKKKTSRRKPPILERTNKVQRLETMYVQYLDDKIKTASSKGDFRRMRLDREDDVLDVHSFEKFCASQKDVVVDSLLRQSLTSNFASAHHRKRTSGVTVDVRLIHRDTEMGGDAAMMRAERVHMAGLKSTAVLKRHRSYADVYDMFSSHMWEKVVRSPLPMQRRKSFPSYTAVGK